jgi:xylan 1,4-beta-xylosidase
LFVTLCHKSDDYCCLLSNHPEWIVCFRSLGANTPNVTGLNLGFNQLSGTLPSNPSVWGALQHLRFLSARSNKLSGTLPTELRLLTKLENLNLRRNRISGTLPEWDPLQRLRHFSVSVVNQLSGTIPASFGSLHELGEGQHGGLDLSNNHLRGSIPASFSSLRHFHEFWPGQGGNIGLGGDGDGNVYDCPVPPITLTNGTVTTTYAHCGGVRPLDELTTPLPPGARQLPALSSTLTNFTFWKMDGSGTYAIRKPLADESDGIRVITFGGSRAAPLVYHACFKGALPFAIQAGDTAVIQFSARASPGATQPPEGPLLKLAFQDNVVAAKYYKYLFQTLRLSPDWQDWSFPVTAIANGKNAPAGQSVIQFEFGFPAFQSFDLKDVKLHVWPKRANVDPHTLPSCCLPNATYPGREANATWRAEALERIDRIRRGTLAVTARDEHGAVVNCHVNTTMLTPSFAFGSAVNEPTWLGKNPRVGNDGGERYRREYRRLFDTAVFESDMKWTQWADSATADNHNATLNIVHELLTSGIRIRGHNLVWPSCGKSGHVPGSVCTESIAHNDSASRAKVEHAILAHIRDEVTTLKAHGCCSEFDVVNEPFENSQIIQFLEQGNQTILRWLAATKKANPGAGRRVNDDHVCTGNSAVDAGKQSFYSSLIPFLAQQDGGGLLTGFGCESHLDGQFLPAPTDMLAWYDKIGQLGGPGFTVRVTEFDIDNIGPQDTQLYADFLRDSLIAAYSSAAADGFLMWGFTDDCHWKQSAPLFAHNWQPKPGLAVWEELVLGNWRSTSAGVISTADGTWESALMHHGVYNVTITCAGHAAVSQRAVLAGNRSAISILLPGEHQMSEGPQVASVRLKIDDIGVSKHPPPCNTSKDAKFNQCCCWNGPSVEARPGGANGSWFFPNVTSFNCSYIVPEIPHEYGSWNGDTHSIFLWCGLQPGGGFGVIQPQIKQNLTTRLYDVCFGRKPTSSERRRSEAAMSDQAGWAGETARVVAQSVAQIVSSTAAALKTDDDNEVAELPVKVDLGSLAPMNMMWQECVGSGHAALWSRADWREHVAIVSREIGFRYIRGHGILDNSVMFYDACPNDGKHEHSNPVGQPGDTASCIPDKNQSTGSYWDAFSAYDYMLSVGAKPIVELSFTPNPLVDQWRPGMPNPSECDHFHYSSCELPPTNLTRYRQLIGKFARALLDRYGADEMRLWKFEVYNEADLHWKFPQYASMYRAAATALKAVHPDLQVGGPASAQPAWVGLLISYCQNMGVPLDFVTTHAYPNETSSLQSQMAQLRVAQRLADTDGGKPLLITEWSSGGTGWVTLPDGSKVPPMHDEWQMAAWIVAAVLNATDTPGVSLAAYSYWALSDVFTEQGLPQSNISFSGNWGLVNIFGVRKPSFRAFQMLSNAGSTRAALTLGHATNPDLHTVALLDGKDLAASKTLTVLVANHACRHRCPKPSPVRLNISITTGAGNTGRIYRSRVATVYRINATSGNPKAAWEKQGAPDYPSPRQIKAIHSASNVKKSTHSISWREHTAKVPDIMVEPYSLVAVRIDLTLPPSDVAVAFAERGDLASAPTKCTGESAGLLSQDCDAWQALFNATNGKHWKHCGGPAGFTDPCACDGAKHFGTGLLCKANAITSLELTMNNLVGSIPAAISQMKALNMLSLPGNHLSGAIPAAIGEMPSLKFLNLWNNHLSGTVPALPFSQYTEECCLTGPKNSGLRDNSFTCPLPPDSKKCVVSRQSGVRCTKALVAAAAQIDLAQPLPSASEAQANDAGTAGKFKVATGPPCSSVGVTCSIGRGAIPDSELGLTEVVWVGGEKKGMYVGSPSIVQFANGTVLASHDFFGPLGTLNATVQVLRDDTGLVTSGSRWVYAGNVSGMYW